MPLEPVLIAYAALTSLALGARHGPLKPPHACATRWPQLAGWPLLATALLAAVLRLGAPVGFIVGIAQLMIAGAILILISSWRPALALGLAAPALFSAALIVALG